MKTNPPQHSRAFSALQQAAVLLETMQEGGELPTWAQSTAQTVIAEYLTQCPGAMRNRHDEALRMDARLYPKAA